MKKQLDELSALKCPLCSKTLASDEYNQAIEDLEKQLEQNFEEKNSTQKEEFESQISKIKEEYEETLAENHKNHKIQLEQMKQEIEESYKEQSQVMEKHYKTILEQNEKQFEQLEEQLTKLHKKELEQKTKEISSLKKEQEKFKKSAMEEADAKFAKKERELYGTIQERDIQISRFTEEIDSLKSQLEKKQSELKGEVGELDLYSTLTKSFENDMFRRQKRGQSTGDVIQQIRIGGKYLDIPIVYDNKNAKTVTKTDITKAKKYQKIHGTNYVVIVSANLPKTSVPNGFYGTKDGILLVHPSIVTEVARQIRSAIIEISKLSTSKDDQKSKQSRLYQFVTSPDFARIVEEIAQTNEKLYLLQAKEEKDHNTMWKTRRELYEQQVRTQSEILSGIESITQTELEKISVEVEK